MLEGDGAQVMEASRFIDYYETLEISPNANAETIDRIFRYFAQRYHPDNQDTVILPDLVKSWMPIIRSKIRSNVRSTIFSIKIVRTLGRKLAAEASDSNGIERDVDIQDKLLSLLYVKRRRNTRDPGIGNQELERLSGSPSEHLEFHLWYLKAKGWIGKLENGTLAITVEGIDRANSEHHRKTTVKLLGDKDPSQKGMRSAFGSLADKPPRTKIQKFVRCCSNSEHWSAQSPFCDRQLTYW